MSESGQSCMSKYFLYYYNQDFCGSLTDKETFDKCPGVSWASFRRYKKQLLAAREEDPEGYAESYKNYFAPPNREEDEEEMMLRLYRSLSDDKKKKITEYMKNMV